MSLKLLIGAILILYIMLTYIHVYTYIYVTSGDNKAFDIIDLYLRGTNLIL